MSHWEFSSNSWILSLKGSPGSHPSLTMYQSQEFAGRLRSMFQHFDSVGLKVKKEKCLLGVGKVDFSGFTVDADGIHPAGDKIRAIMEAPAPKSKAELQVFLGLLKFYHTFCCTRQWWQSPYTDFWTKMLPGPRADGKLGPSMRLRTFLFPILSLPISMRSCQWFLCVTPLHMESKLCWATSCRSARRCQSLTTHAPCHRLSGLTPR